MVNTIDKGIGIPDQRCYTAALFMGCSISFFFWFSFNLDCILGPLIGTSITQSKEDASIRVKVLFLLLRSCYRLSFSRCRSVTFWQFFKGFQVESIVEIKIKSCILVAEFVLWTSYNDILWNHVSHAGLQISVSTVSLKPLYRKFP